VLSEKAYQDAYHRFCQKLRHARLDANLSQSQLALLLGKPQSFVSKVESGERRLDFVELQAFVGVLGKPLGYFSD